MAWRRWFQGLTRAEWRRLGGVGGGGLPPHALRRGVVPFLAVISLPLLFAAGMCLMDTADGAFMSQAYGWAFSNPVRRVYYNITVTSLSVAVALAIGTVELLQVLGFLNGLDFGQLGYGVVGLFVATWATSVLVWKVRRLEERWTTLLDRA